MPLAARRATVLLLPALATLAALALVACPAGEPHIALGMSDSTFIQTIVRLRKLDGDSTIDSLARDSARRVVLRQQRVTVRQLDEAARLLALQPSRAETLWRAVEEQMLTHAIARQPVRRPPEGALPAPVPGRAPPPTAAPARAAPPGVSHPGNAPPRKF